MISALLGLRRKPEVDLREVRERAVPALEALLARYCAAAGAEGFRIHHPFQVEENAWFQEAWGGLRPYDLMVEIIWRDGPACREGAGRQEAVAIEAEWRAGNTLFDGTASSLTYLQDLR